MRSVKSHCGRWRVLTCVKAVEIQEDMTVQYLNKNMSYSCSSCRMLHNSLNMFELKGPLRVNAGKERSRKGVALPPSDRTIAEARGESPCELCLLSHVLFM